MPDEKETIRKAYSERAAKLKQRDKIKIFNLILDAYENHLNLEETFTEALKWAGKLCDPVK